jgi:hypothetical protein
MVQEGIKSGNVSETCRRYEIAPNPFYRWKDEAEQGAKPALRISECSVVLRLGQDRSFCWFRWFRCYSDPETTGRTAALSRFELR